jgi:NAD(P)H-nitrite reductase large subunit
MELKAFIEQLPMRAVKPRKDGTFTVVPRMSQGKLAADHLIAIAKVVEEYGLEGVRLSTGQRLLIDGVPGAVLPEVIDKVGPVGDIYKHKVQACLGTTGCNLGQQDSMAVAAELEEFLNDYELPTKLKSSASGCSMCCGESMIRDVGLVGKKHGWTVSFGGNGGKRARQADVLAQDVPKEEAFEIIGRALDFYATNAKVKERTARFVERVGIKAVEQAVFGR